MDKQGKTLSDAVVVTGRYTRSQMLRAVSLNWSKYSENLTATMYELISHSGNKSKNKNAEMMARISSSPDKKPVLDFVHEYNTPYPLVDIEKILNLPDPISESELVRPSDVEENKKNYGALDMPVDASKTPMPQSSRTTPRHRQHNALLPIEPEPDTFFGKAFAWLLSEKNSNLTNIKKSTSPKPVLRQKDPKSAFDDLEGLADVCSEDQTLTEDILKKLNAWLNPFVKVNIPYIDTDLHSFGKVIFPPSDQDFEQKCREDGIEDPRPYKLSFEGVPQVLNVDGGPDEEWISSQKGKMWDIGKYNEPRILAHDPMKNVLARYRMNGECVVGEGAPPVWINEQGSIDSPVYIVAGAKEWFWLRQNMEDRNKDDLSKMPHIIWAAKDMDWSLIAPSLHKSKHVVIVRSKADDRQIPWAVDLQKMLKNRFGIDTVMSPKLPENEVVMINPDAINEPETLFATPASSGRFRR